MLNVSIQAESAIRSHLASRLISRDGSIAADEADAYVADLVPDAMQWLKRMSLNDLGCRPIYADGNVVGAMLCDHTVDGCDCGAH